MTVLPPSLAVLSQGYSRDQALLDGAIIDTSAAAAFLGFSSPAGVSAAVWDEVIGTPGVLATAAEKARAVAQLRQVWIDAREAVRRSRVAGTARSPLAFRALGLHGRAMWLELVASTDAGRAVLTIYLQGET